MELPENCLEYLSESWNQFTKLLGVRLVVCKVKWNPYQDDGNARGSKVESKDGVSLSPSRHLPNLEDEIHLMGVEL